ncbi:Uncharacterised protein [Vibrio owensii]|nr:hypothetical protein ACOMICROBIO_LMKGKHOH_01066 [Vibrio sp. B1FIG11]CAE6884583.1 hypothetical protein ACOMICROBIO_LMKGKHOH_01066 [Vibrio sp. B1FIG11]SUP92122.1 Uncharacterised protein [Vibrio owensii]
MMWEISTLKNRFKIIQRDSYDRNISTYLRVIK